MNKDFDQPNNYPLQETFDKVNNLLGFGSTNNFMNHGYVPSHNDSLNCEVYSKLEGYHKFFNHQSNLYIKLLQNFHTENTSILDIGCGRGGGLDLYKKYFSFSKVTGIDAHPENIKHCKSYLKDISVQQGNAENLEFPDESFDFVSNVESAHCYTNHYKFYDEVWRVLRPNGIFLYTDNYEIKQRNANSYHPRLLDQVLPFKKIIREDISEAVFNACRLDYLKFINSSLSSKVKNHLIPTALETFKLYGLKEWGFFIYICFK